MKQATMKAELQKLESQIDSLIIIGENSIKRSKSGAFCKQINLQTINDNKEFVDDVESLKNAISEIVKKYTKREKDARKRKISEYYRMSRATGASIKIPTLPPSPSHADDKNKIKKSRAN